MNTMSDTGSGKLVEESLKRKEKLRLLREKAQKLEQKNGGECGGQLSRPVFRSYKPQNENTLGEIIPQQPSGDIEDAVEDQLSLISSTTVVEDIDIDNLAPRKPDWDLKRDVAKKLERLDRRTQKAIAELIRDRLKSNQEGQDIFQAVNVATAHVGSKNG
ncbi:coiled-coil domain-containing protein 12 [Musca domestica]|uniref:Coiled-coil domain-containing protein 12 n=1 Tax=Musca domestica TaxID=7370 RepID=A0A1I8MKR1_MUSDO|nr:coiled-coil domain-containing protein 12 [Musca domestica]